MSHPSSSRTGCRNTDLAQGQTGPETDHYLLRMYTRQFPDNLPSAACPSKSPVPGDIKQLLLAVRLPCTEPSALRVLCVILTAILLSPFGKWGYALLWPKPWLKPRQTAPPSTRRTTCPGASMADFASSFSLGLLTSNTYHPCLSHC